MLNFANVLGPTAIQWSISLYFHLIDSIYSIFWNLICDPLTRKLQATLLNFDQFWNQSKLSSCSLNSEIQIQILLLIASFEHSKKYSHTIALIYLAVNEWRSWVNKAAKRQPNLKSSGCVGASGWMPEAQMGRLRVVTVSIAGTGEWLLYSFLNQMENQMPRSKAQWGVLGDE